MDRKTYTFPDGTTYDGEWDGKKRHGYGVWVRPDGMRYEGEWKNNKPNGKGTLTYPDGRKKTGEWSDGKYIGEKQQTTDRDQQIQALLNENRDLKEEVANLKQRIYTVEKPPQDKKKMWWVLAAVLFTLVVIVVVISVGGEEPVAGTADAPGEETVADVEAEVEPEPEPEPEPEIEITLAGIGETTSFAEWEYKVVDVEYHKTLRNERARGVFVVFIVEATNNSNVPRQIGRMFQVEDDQGRVFVFDSRASLGHHHTFDIDVWHHEDIGASFTGKMPIAFDIPEDVETLFFYPSDIRDEELDSTAIIMIEVEN